jgi:hypothetical protein
VRGRLPLLWLLLAVPGAFQLALLVVTVVQRFGYPYDLEWMEGGMLVHALRVAEGQPLYAPPSVDFVPYLYTPIYPTVLAGLGAITGLSYQLGRAVSVLSMLAVCATLAVAIVRESREKIVGAVGAACAIGFFAATYPWVEGWYDLVRGDTLFLAMGVAGLALLRAWARRPSSPALFGFWHPRTMIVAAILALSFFCKQTGVLLVVAGGAALLVMNWRALPGYVLTAGAIGGGGSAILDYRSGGWFWIYVFEYHQQHDTNADRFWRSFGYILWKFPAMTCVVVFALVAVAVTTIWRRRLPRGAGGLLYWAALFAIGTLIGAVGWATQWAHFNAYIPAMTFGAAAAGAAVVAIAGCLEAILGAPWRHGAALVAALLGVQLVMARWSPARWVPAPQDRAAGDRLIGALAAVDGDVFMPFHPWYPHLAGKPAHTHRMGILDVTYAPPPKAGKKKLPPQARRVAGLTESFAERRWAAIVLDDKAQLYELPGLNEHYRLDRNLARAEMPRVVTGAPTTPRTVWVPKRDDPPPPGVRVLFDFEGGRLDGWQRTGTAWGGGAVMRGVPSQGQVGGYRGRYFVDSMHGGDAARGTLVSPPVTLQGARILLRVGGGLDEARLRVELRLADGKVARATTGFNSEVMRTVTWDVAELRGQTVTFALVDDSNGPWGHLTVDEIWEVAQ